MYIKGTRKISGGGLIMVEFKLNPSVTERTPASSKVNIETDYLIGHESKLRNTEKCP